MKGARTQMDDRMTRSSGLVRRAMPIIAAIALSLVGPMPASAAPGHGLEDRFGGPGAGPGSFSLPSGIGVDPSTHDVFVADQNNGRIQRFTADGDFVDEFDGAGTPSGSMTPGDVVVDPVSGDVYVADVVNGVVNRFTASGTYLSQVDASTVGGPLQPAGLDVGRASGTLYITNFSQSAVHVVDSAGALQSTITGLAFPINVAVDSNANVYVAEGFTSSATVRQFAPDGTPMSTVFPDASAYSIAIGPDDDLFVLETPNFGGSVRMTQIYDGATLRTSFADGEVGVPVFTIDGRSPAGVAIDYDSGRVYVADQVANDVAYFDAFTLPDVTTGPASNETPEGATVSGTLDPLGIPSTSHFDYGLTTAYGSSTPAVDAGSGTGTVNAEATLTGLQPSQTYHYRLVGSNLSGSNPGQDQTFVTQAAPPAVDGTAPFGTNVKATNARFNATVNPNNLPTTYRFEYGTSEGALDSSTSAQDAGSGFGDAQVSELVTGLTPSTTYYFRVVADNGTGGPVAGATGTFTTPALLPAVSIGQPSEVTSSSATIHATVDTHGLPGTYQFSVEGVSSAYSSLTGEVPLGPAAGARAISAVVSGLPASGTFHVRAIAKTETGTTQSAATTFATLPVQFSPPPGPAIDDVAPYGCASPRLTGYRGRAVAGRAITLEGADLGVTGVVNFGSSQVDASSWAVDRVRVVVPRRARGRLKVTAACPNVSTSISVRVIPRKKARKCKAGYVRKSVKRNGKRASRCVKKRSSKGAGR